MRFTCCTVLLLIIDVFLCVLNVLGFVCTVFLAYSVAILAVYLSLSYKREIWLAIKFSSTNHFFSLKCHLTCQKYCSCYLKECFRLLAFVFVTVQCFVVFSLKIDVFPLVEVCLQIPCEWLIRIIEPRKKIHLLIIII